TASSAANSCRSTLWRKRPNNRTITGIVQRGDPLVGRASGTPAKPREKGSPLLPFLLPPLEPTQPPTRLPHTQSQSRRGAVVKASPKRGRAVRQGRDRSCSLALQDCCCGQAGRKMPPRWLPRSTTKA